MTGDDVMKMVYEENQKKSTRQAVVNMIIYDDEDRVRRRHFNYWVQFTDVDEKSLIKFFRPKNLKGMAVLTNSDKETEVKLQWIYLSAFKSVKRLTSLEKNNSFMGSDFTFSDIAGRKRSQDEHQLMKDSDDYYFIESVPKVVGDSIYSKIRYVVSKKYNLVIKAVFYDLEGNKLKTLTNTEISQVNEVNIVMGAKMENHQTSGWTILTIQNIEVGIVFDDDLFTIKGLQTQ